MLFNARSAARKADQPRLLGHLRRLGYGGPWLRSLNQENLCPVAFEFRSGVLVNIIQHCRAIQFLKRRIRREDDPGPPGPVYDFLQFGKYFESPANRRTCRKISVRLRSWLYGTLELKSVSRK